MSTIPLGLKDRKILLELDKDCRRSNSEIGKKVGLSKESVNYRIGRLINNEIITRFATVVDTYKLGYSKYKLYLHLENVNEERFNKIINHLKNNEKTEWIATCSGKCDIIAGFLVKNKYEFYDAERDFLEKFSKYIAKKDTTISLGVRHWKKEYLIDKKMSQIKPVLQGYAIPKKTKLDKIDEEILKILVNNAKMPIVDIAKRLKTTPRIVNYRIKELRKKEILPAHKIFLNMPLFNFIFCKAIITFRNLTKEKYNKFISYCGQIPNLTYIIDCIGSWDIELDFELENFNRFHEIMLDIRDRFSDIIKEYDFIIVMNEDKLDFYPGAYKVFNAKV